MSHLVVFYILNNISDKVNATNFHGGTLYVGACTTEVTAQLCGIANCTADDKVLALRKFPSVLGAFVRLRKATASLCQSVRMEQLGSQWSGFGEILYFRFFFENLRNRSSFF